MLKPDLNRKNNHTR